MFKSHPLDPLSPINDESMLGSRSGIPFTSMSGPDVPFDGVVPKCS